MTQQREQFPRWAQPTLGKWWRPITLLDWYRALVAAGMILDATDDTR